MQRSAQEIAEIERHKYFLSEKQGRDVGWEFAERDWELHHGEQWRRQQARGGPSACDRPAATSTCCQPTQATQVTELAEVVEAQAPRPMLRKDAAKQPAERGPLRWLLARLFQHQTP